MSWVEAIGALNEEVPWVLLHRQSALYIWKKNIGRGTCSFLSFLKFDRSLYVGGHDHINVNGISNQNVLLQFHRKLKNKKNLMYIE